MMVPAIGIIDIDIDPILVHVGGVAIHWYGIMYVVGIVAAYYAVLPYLIEHGVTREIAGRVFLPVIVAGLVGGRLYWVLQSKSSLGDTVSYYARNPGQVIATWEGGMAFFGAIIGASLMIVYQCWRRKVPMWIVLDAAAMFAPFGQAFGRVGNIINGDIIGFKSNCPWCVRYVNANSLAPSHTASYQPAAAYELLISLAIFAIVYSLRHKLHHFGELFGLYLMLYAASQFAIFFIRASEPVTLIGLKQAQLTAIPIFVLGVIVFAYTSRRSLLKASPAMGDAVQLTNATPSG
jgi:phosphatidylglycerol:prolipoprotein diacylglycerol transferase